MHVPVLLKEVLTYLNPGPNDNFIDATIGRGGHSLAILEKTAPQGKILGIEWDHSIFQDFQSQINSNPLLSQRLILRNDSFVNVDQIVHQERFSHIEGILFDLGLNSWHLDESGRGFTFRKDEPLDMRFTPKNGPAAAMIINSWPQQDLERILRELGEEKYSQRIARTICRERKKERILTTGQLVHILDKSLPDNYKHHRLHFATKTFQALRITVNNELDNLQKGLEHSLRILPAHSRLVVISFHSLEDRIVKRFLREQQKNQILTILTKKPITPTSEEKQKNSRARSAKLRAAIINAK